MEKINILVDKTLDEDTALLLSKYADVKITDTSSSENELLRDADVLCIRTNTIINKEYMENAPKVKIIATATTGMNHINLKETNSRGIKVLDAKGANADSVADYVFRILFEVTDDAYYTNKMLKESPESFLKIKKENKRRELGSLSIGIIGLGNIGSRVAKRANAFGMNVKAYDPYVKDAQNTLEEVLGCDVVTIHAELTDETRNMITYELLSLLKQDVILINAARAEIIEEDALRLLLDERRNMHAIIDVFKDEPVPSLFYKNSNCTVTPHIAGNAAEAKKRAAAIVAEKVLTAMGEIPAFNMCKVKGDCDETVNTWPGQC